MGLFVDDGVILSKSKEAIAYVLSILSREFKITTGTASYFVGLEIERDRTTRSLHISQRKYAERIVSKFGMSNAKPVAVPADPNVVLHLVEREDDCLRGVPYREAVGSLMFLAIISRPDIALAVNVVSKFLNKHNRSHWQAVRRIFAYLAGSTNLGICFRGECGDELVGYSDADFANDIETRRSVTGFVSMMSGGAVTWCAQRQKIVTLSTTEAEYVAANMAAVELIWLRSLLADVERPCASPTFRR